MRNAEWWTGLPGLSCDDMDMKEECQRTRYQKKKQPTKTPSQSKPSTTRERKWARTWRTGLRRKQRKWKEL